MSAQVLLNLLNELRKNELNARCAENFAKFNNTLAQMLDSIHHIF